MALYDDLMNACSAQSTWMEHSTYKWQSNPTIAKSYYYGTCVTYVACVLQRINILQPGQFIWHNSSGQVVGANNFMEVIYPGNVNLHQIASQLQPGDIIMDGAGYDMEQGSHVFIITGNWSGSNPIIWDNHSAQQHLGAHVYTRNRHVIAIVRLGGAAFTPRLTSSGISGNPYWYSKNPFYLSGYGLPNCTCYAWGRVFEETDINHDYSNPPTLSLSDAENWYGYTQDGYQRGSTPQLGAVACWADGPFSGDGHVAIVEEINADTGEITCSNSAYGGQFFYLTHLSPPNYLPAAGYVFQGFIYIPNVGAGSPIWSNTDQWLFKKIIWRKRKEDL